MATKTKEDKNRSEKIQEAKRIAQIALGGASIGTMIGATFATAGLAPVIGAVIGAMSMAALSTIVDQDEDTVDSDEE